MANAANVTAAKPKISGAVQVAPVGTTLPTTTEAELNPAFKALGYVSEDGLSNNNSRTNEAIKAWGGETVLNSQTEFTDNFKFTLLEIMNPEVLRTVYGKENVSEESDELTLKVNAAQPNSNAFVFDMILKGGAKKRIVVPSASMTALEEIVYKDNGAVGYGITIGAVPDTAGNTHYEYIKKGAGAGGGT